MLGGWPGIGLSQRSSASSRGRLFIKPERVGVARAMEDRVDIPDLDDVSRVHDGDPVGHLGDDSQVVSDHDRRGVRFDLRLLHYFEDLSLDGDVERGGGFVRNQE